MSPDPISSQHRFTFAGIVAVFGAAALYLLIAGLAMHDPYAPVSACRPVVETWRAAASASAGLPLAANAAPSASAIITDRLCATMSCISRAIRARSAAAASCACWSRSFSARRARSSSDAR